MALLCGILIASVCSVPVYAADEAPQEIGASYQYPAPEVMQLDIVMQPSAFLKMIETPSGNWDKSENRKTYDATISVNAGEWQYAGVRLRANPDYLYPGKRLPLEICFDHVQADGAYHGNPSWKLVRCEDAAQLFVQTVAMEAYRFMGIPTPEMTPVFVRINDEDFGLYLAVEDLNEAFIRKYYDGTGSLYRGHDLGETISGFFRLRVKVDHGSTTLEQLGDAIEKNQPIDPFFQVDACLRFMACEAFTFDTDGFLVSHNYFLYDDHGRLVLLPWDKDLTFQCFNEEVSSFGHTVRSFVPASEIQNPALYRLMQDPEHQTRFYAYIARLNDVFLDPDRFLPWLQSYIAAMVPTLERDPVIPLLSDPVYDELTMGNLLYAGSQSAKGNLLLTFQTIHTQLREQLQNRQSVYSVPEDCAVLDFKMDQSTYEQAYAQGQAMIRQICANYWKLRRQAFWQTCGPQTVGIGCVFLAVAGIAVLSLRVPKGGFRRRKKKEDVRNE